MNQKLIYFFGCVSPHYGYKFCTAPKLRFNRQSDVLNDSLTIVDKNKNSFLFALNEGTVTGTCKETNMSI